MAIQQPNIYARCRQRLGISQETWAERLKISVDSVKRYETGERVPNNVIVSRMINESGYEALAMQHVYETSRPLDVLPDAICDTPLPQAAIKLINRVFRFVEEHRDKQLLQISEDGIVSDDERPLYNDILEDLIDIIQASYQLRYSDEEGRV